MSDIELLALMVEIKNMENKEFLNRIMLLMLQVLG